METRCQDIGTPTAPHSASHCGSSSSSSNVANVLVVPVPPLPYIATRLCRFHFIIVITLCHNLLCSTPPTLPPPSPPFTICTWYEQRRHYYYAISVCQKRGQFPWPGPAAIFPLLSLSLSLCHFCAANCFHGTRQVFNYWQIERHRQLKAIN